MLFSKHHVKQCAQYFERLEKELRVREGDPEYTGVGRPTNAMFRQMELVTDALCTLGGNSTINSTFSVTGEGSMETAFQGFKHVGRGWIRVEKDGVRMYNAQDDKKYFLAGVHTSEQLQIAFKKAIKDYL